MGIIINQKKGCDFMQTARKKNISVILSQPEYDRSIKVQFKMLRVAASRLQKY